MSFGQNLLFLRKMNNNLTQEELAEKMGVSRQTVSKWELDAINPEVDKLVKLCEYFSCTMDALVRENMNMCSEAYSNFRVEEVSPFRYIRYAVISSEPEEDAILHIHAKAEMLGIANPQIIGWDFPFVSQEQINVFHMHGYTAACILPCDFEGGCDQLEVLSQNLQKYAAISIKEPFKAPFDLIPNAYKNLISYIKVNGLKEVRDSNVISCFEKTYDKDGINYMDVFIAVE